MTDEEIDKLLRDIKGDSAIEDDVPQKEWSMEAIDKLIYETADKEEVKAYSLDKELFTIKPLNEIEDYKEPEDIFSGSEPELDGQETLFGKEEDNFKFEDLNLETIVIPDSVPENDGKFAEVKSYMKALTQENDDDNTFTNPVTLSEDYDFYDEEPENETDITPFDRAGMVITKSDEQADLGLESMPIIHSAQSILEKDRIEFKKESEDNEASKGIEGQIILNGFTGPDEDSAPNSTRVSEVETSLQAKRKLKIKTFKLENINDDFREDFEEVISDQPKEKTTSHKVHIPQDENVTDNIDIDEYTSPSQKNNFNAKLTALEKAIGGKITITFAIMILMCLLSILPTLITKLNLNLRFITDSYFIPIINFAAITAVGLIFRDKFLAGIKSITELSPSIETSCTVSLIFGAIHSIACIFSAGSNLVSVTAVMLCLAGVLSDMLDITRILGNFSVCAYKYDHDMSAVHAFDNESEINEIGSGSFSKDAKILYSSIVEFPSDFIKNSSFKPSERSTNTVFFFISLVISAVLSVILGSSATNSSFANTFGIFLIAFCLTSPIFLKLIPAHILSKENKKLNLEGSVIASFKAAEDSSTSQAIILDGSDIFDKSQCTMHGMKHFNGIRIDEVLLYAAAIVIKSGGPLKECFEKVIDGQQDLLPLVKELTYEDKLGISARINTERVLWGNRNMLINHNITPPDIEVENRYSNGGKKVLYLASNEKLAGLFVVSYAVEEKIKPYLKTIAANNIQTLVRTNDANVTEQMLATSLDMSVANFKILTSAGYNVYKRRKDSVSDRLPCSLITDGSSKSMLKVISICCKLCKKKKIVLAFQIFAVICGALLTVFLSTAGVAAGIFSILIMFLLIILSFLC